MKRRKAINKHTAAVNVKKGKTNIRSINCNNNAIIYVTSEDDQKMERIFLDAAVNVVKFYDNLIDFLTRPTF